MRPRRRVLLVGDRRCSSPRGRWCGGRPGGAGSHSPGPGDFRSPAGVHRCRDFPLGWCERGPQVAGQRLRDRWPGSADDLRNPCVDGRRDGRCGTGLSIGVPSAHGSPNGSPPCPARTVEPPASNGRVRRRAWPPRGSRCLQRDLDGRGATRRDGGCGSAHSRRSRAGTVVTRPTGPRLGWHVNRT